MKAIILAAGRGSRLGPLTETNPKGLVKLNGRPLLDYQLHALRRAGVAEIIVVSGYMAQSIRCEKVTLLHNPDWARTNMLRSLLVAAQYLQTEPCVVTYSDIIYPTGAVVSLLGGSGDIRITYDPSWLDLWSRRFADPLADAETFRVNTAGVLTEIGGKTRQATDIQGQYMGLLYFTPAGWRQVGSCLHTLGEREIDALDMTALIRLLLADGVTVNAVPVDVPWVEVDNESDLRLYQGWMTEAANRYGQMIREYFRD